MTGLISHYAQNVSQPLPFPTSPAWGYRVTQGLHVITGTAAVPLLLVKLWTVYPQAVQRPPRGRASLAVEVLERGSIGVLVAAAIFQLASGLANAAQWYPWNFSFRRTHYAMAWVAIGALVVHIAVKLPIIRGALAADVEDTTYDRPAATRAGALSRRGLLRATWAATGSRGAGRRPATRCRCCARCPSSPSARARVRRGCRSTSRRRPRTITDEMRRVGIPARGGRTATARCRSTRDELLGHDAAHRELPIACVEGWSASGEWTGVRVRDLLDLVDAPSGRDVRRRLAAAVRRRSGAPCSRGTSPTTTAPSLALALHGEPLSRDHG